MKFIRKEQIVTTIFDKELTKEDEIKTVFKNLYDYKIEFSIIIRKYIPSDYDYITLTFDKARIKKIYEDDTFDLLVFKSGVKTEMKKVAVEDVIEINATTVKHRILDVDSDITRWDLLDIRDE